jgi:RimJ/RimL family protein N-acetyltransferase
MRVETDRLILRDFVADDWCEVLSYQRDPRYLRYYPWTDRSESDAKAFVRIFLDQQQANPRRQFQLAVTLREDGRLVGNCGIRCKADDDHEVDVGYELAPDYWGKGYATEAARAMVDYGFRELGMHRVSSWCILGNVRSAKVLERLGMRQEGRLRENEYFKDRWWDTLLYGILEDEWRAAPGTGRGEEASAP